MNDYTRPFRKNLRAGYYQEGEVLTLRLLAFLYGLATAAGVVLAAAVIAIFVGGA